MLVRAARARAAARRGGRGRHPRRRRQPSRRRDLPGGVPGLGDRVDDASARVVGVPCPGCGRGYDATQFAFGRTLHCACGVRVDWASASSSPARLASRPDAMLEARWRAGCAYWASTRAARRTSPTRRSCAARSRSSAPC
ncbi:MAG: hypothetical protein MZV64_35225 [Ignavibacteriales bacterium]|nr:hypothetical protein [Ignavibacteriales bacterium]